MHAVCAAAVGAGEVWVALVFCAIVAEFKVPCSVV